MRDDPTAVDWHRCADCSCSSAEVGRAGGCPFEVTRTENTPLVGEWKPGWISLGLHPYRGAEEPDEDQSQPLTSTETRGLLLPALLAVALVVAMVSCVVRWPR